MKKFLLSLALLLLLPSFSYGAVSDDVYVRKDVFDANINAVIARIDSLEKSINTRFESLNTRINSVENVMNTRFNAIDRRIDDMNTRIGDTQTMVYGGFTALGVLMTLLTFAPSLWGAVKNVRRPSLTIEDVKRLIAESKLEVK